jgi:hypothetical protein
MLILTPALLRESLVSLLRSKTVSFSSIFLVLSPRHVSSSTLSVSEDEVLPWTAHLSFWTAPPPVWR